jgi:hypothetical protein
MTPDPQSAALLADIAASAEDLDRGRHDPSHEVGVLLRHGWLKAVLPVAHGGRGWGQSADGARDGFAALFALGSVSLPVTRIFEGHCNAVRLIDRHGTPAQRNRIFAAVRGGALLAIWGADTAQPVKIAGGRLVGTKAFASGLGVVAQAIVTATDEQGACRMVVVPADDRARWDLSAWDVAAMVGTCSGEFCVDSLPADDLLGDPGALLVEPDFNGGVWRLCAAYAGAMGRIAQQALEHAGQRGPVGDPQVRARLGHVRQHAQTALLWAWHACQALEIVGDLGKAMAASLFAREAIEQVAAQQMSLVERIAGTSLHRCGSAPGRMCRDLRFFLRQAALDAKLDAAFSIWADDPSPQPDDVIDAPGPGPMFARAAG